MKKGFLFSEGNQAGKYSRNRNLLILLVALLSLACGAAANATTFMVTVGPSGGLFFSPATLTIQAGDTVQWVWGSSTHSSTSGTPGAPDGIWDSGIKNKNDTFSFTFLNAGSFPYFCTPHGLCCGMTGVITVTAPSPTPTPTPTATPTPSPSPSPSPSASPSPTASPTPSATPVIPTLANISTRGDVQGGDNVLIGGFIITGTDSKKIIVRALGPSLTAQGVDGALADPTLELHHSVNNTDTVIAFNDNWMDASNKQEIIDSTLAPTNELESAILIDSLDPGTYTAIVRGVNILAGIGLVEVFDLNSGTSPSILANISTRGLVGTGDNVLIGGIIILGASDQEVLIRAIGPSLTALGVDGALADPVLELRDKDGNLIISNDNWMDAPNEQAIIDTKTQPTDPAESAILITLAPNNYTAIVSGKNGTSGVALVEAYQIDN